MIDKQTKNVADYCESQSISAPQIWVDAPH